MNMADHAKRVGVPGDHPVFTDYRILACLAKLTYKDSINACRLFTQVNFFRNAFASFKDMAKMRYVKDYCADDVRFDWKLLGD